MVMINHNLHIFLEVAERGSMTDAANALFISQPAISKAIRVLERELNVKLFHRDKRKGLILTDVGQEILHIARQMADQENRLYQTAYRANHLISGKVRVASMPILTSLILAQPLHRFRQRHPSVRVELREGSAMEIRRAIFDHAVDFAILSEPFEGLDVKQLLCDHMIAVSRDPLSENVVDLRHAPERFIFCRAGGETAMELLRAQHISVAQSFLVEQGETVLHLAASRNGIGIVSELVVNQTPNDLLRYPIQPAISYDIGLAASDLNDLTPAAAALSAMILESCQSAAR